MCVISNCWKNHRIFSVMAWIGVWFLLSPEFNFHFNGYKILWSKNHVHFYKFFALLPGNFQMSAIFPSPCTIPEIWTQTILFGAEFWAYRGLCSVYATLRFPEHSESSFLEQYWTADCRSEGHVQMLCPGSCPAPRQTLINARSLPETSWKLQ